MSASKNTTVKKPFLVRRRIFYIDVGTMPPEKAKKHLDDFKKKFEAADGKNHKTLAGRFNVVNEFTYFGVPEAGMARLDSRDETIWEPS